MDSLPAALLPLLHCPVCTGAITALHCTHCHTQFFSFAGIPSLLPAGVLQKRAWQHQLAVMNQQAQSSAEVMESVLDRPDILPTTRQRTESSLQTAQRSNQILNQLFQDAGMEANFAEQFLNVPLGQISEYYYHVLQDWAWSEALIAARVDDVITLADIPKSSTILALGAGAGRLCWELHKHWDAQLSLATDISPLLLLAGHKLIVQRESFEFCELNSFPQIARDLSRRYTLRPPADPADKRRSWFCMAADVWRMPLKPQSFDVIVTAWFIDVHGGDNRDLVALIHRWLKPGGIWLNSGPLLYPKNTDFARKYDRDELRQLLELADFAVEKEQVTEQRHLTSPLNVRCQTEQVWSFAARKQSSGTTTTNKNLPPPWLVFHNLPIPPIFKITAQSHPLINSVIALIDGKASIQEICTRVATQIPEGLDVRETVVAICGELVIGEVS